MRRLKVRHVIIAALITGPITLLLVMFMLGWLVQPDDAVPELKQRPVPERRVADISPRPLFAAPVQVSGRVQHPDGAPVEGVTVSFIANGEPEPLALVVSLPDGRFAAELDGPATATLLDRPSDPETVVVEASRDDLVFTTPELCPFEVQVVGPDDAPLEGAKVTANLTTDLGSHSPPKQYSDAQGLAAFDQLPCGVASVKASLKGYASVRQRGVDVLTRGELTLRMAPGILLSGTVYDGQDGVVEGARVEAGEGWVRSKEDGGYRIRVDPRQLTRVSASKDGYQEDSVRLRLPADQTDDATVDFILDGNRQVTVYCAGLPDDSCESVGMVMCTSPMLPMGSICSGEPLTCDCPQGVAAVRGGGESTRVEPDEQVAWLDMRHGGGVMGRVVQADEPAACSAFVFRVPKDLPDLSKGLIIGRNTRCDADGNFEALGLIPGTYLVELRSAGQSRQLPYIDVYDQVVDVGTIELEGGGRIEGVVLDGLTGEGAPNVPVSAVAKVEDDSELPNTANAMSGNEGRFVLTVPEDGPYEVFVSMRPFETVEVQVTDGVGDSQPELETGQADLLEEAGFELVTDGEGRLKVDQLDAQGAAAQGGMQQDDLVVGVTLMGMDVRDYVPGWSDTVLDLVLENYDGPGVGLVVEREGEEYRVDLSD